MSRLKAAPAGLWLAGIVVLGGAAWSIEALRLENWVVQTDELQYVRNAMSVADGLAIVPAIHGEHFGSFSLFALLIAPFYAVFDTGTAFDLAHVAGAFAMASAAIPVFLLARELTESRLAALLAAALAISIPWFSLVTMLRTELVAYPAFLWAVLAMQRGVAEPSTRRDLLALAALGVALLARTQLLALAFAYPLAIVLHETGYALVGRPRGSLADAVKRSVTRHPLVAAAAALGAVLALSGVAASALGSYEVVGRRDLLPAGVWDQARWQLAIVVIATGGIPFVLGFGWLVETLFRPATRAAHAYAVVALAAGFAIVIQASGFVIQFVEGVNYQDRYFFYVAPLLLIAMVGWLTAERRMWVGAAAGAIAFFWLATRHTFAQFNVYSYSPTSAFNFVWNRRAGQISDWLGGGISTRDVVRWGGLALGLAVAVAARYVPRRVALVAVCGVLIAFGAIQGGYIVNKILPTQAERLPTADWVDDARPDDERVGMLPGSFAAPWNPAEVLINAAPWWNVEFWNKSVDRLYVRGLAFTGFPRQALAIDPATGRLRTPQPLRPYLVSLRDRSDLRLRGEVVARRPPLELVRLEQPHAAEWALDGLIRGSSIARQTQATLRLFPGERPLGRRVTLTLQTPPRLGRPQRYAITTPDRTLRGRLRAGRTATHRIPVCIGKGPVPIRVRVGREYMSLPAGQVGLRLAAVRSRPDPAAC